MLHKFLLIGASALALASSALAALPAVADDNDFFYLTQPNGKKILSAMSCAKPTKAGKTTKTSFVVAASLG